jgi:hypothetical protein
VTRRRAESKGNCSRGVRSNSARSLRVGEGDLLSPAGERDRGMG